MGEFPSKEHQFSSTNQPIGNGRVKGSLNISTIIKKIFDEEITDADGNVTVQSFLMVKAILDKAKKGDVPAFKALVERLEGLPTQKIESEINQKVIEIIEDDRNKD